MTTSLYCDGGVIGANPSKVGGTWAFCIVDAGERIMSGSSVFAPTDELPAITNNFTEMLALINGLRALPDGWAGTVYSDSQITLGRAFDGWKWTNIPDWLHREYQVERARLDWKNIKHILVQGHPTKAELAAGIGSRGYPVSEFNVWCDKACGDAGRWYLDLVKECEGNGGDHD